MFDCRLAFLNPRSKFQSAFTKFAIIMTGILALQGSEVLLEVQTASNMHTNFCVNSAIRYLTSDRAISGKIRSTRSLPNCQRHSILFL